MSLKEYKRLRFVHLANALHIRRLLKHSWLDDQTRGGLEMGLKRERGELRALRSRFWGQHRLAS